MSAGKVVKPSTKVPDIVEVEESQHSLSNTANADEESYKKTSTEKSEDYQIDSDQL